MTLERIEIEKELKPLSQYTNEREDQSLWVMQIISHKTSNCSKSKNGLLHDTRRDNLLFKCQSHSDNRSLCLCKCQHFGYTSLANSVFNFKNEKFLKPSD